MANQIKQVLGTPIVFKSASGDVVFTPTSLGAAAGRQSARYDFGTAAAPRRFAWRAWAKTTATSVIGEILEVYLATDDGTSPDTDHGTSDAALGSAEYRRNVQFLGAAQVYKTNTAHVIVASGIVEIGHRYGAVAFWNATANSLSTTATDYGFSLTPIIDEIQ